MEKSFTYMPKCPRCSGINFVATADVPSKSDKAVAFIICANDECQIVLGVLPFDSVFD